MNYNRNFLKSRPPHIAKRKLAKSPEAIRDGKTENISLTENVLAFVISGGSAICASSSMTWSKPTG